MTAAGKLRRAQAERFKLLREDEPVQDRITETAHVKLPNGAAVILARFLPFNFQNTTGREADPAAGGSMYSIIADSNNWLHIVEVAGAGTGNVVLSQASGHMAAFTSLAVDPRQLPEYKIVTGSSDGEVRMHTLNAPPRKRQPARTQPISVPQPPLNHSDQWVPVLSLSANYSPATAPTVRGLSQRYNPVDYADNGTRPITALEFIQKGRSYNILVADDIGRISLHLRNGSISATAQTKGGVAVRCAVAFNNLCALCTDSGIIFYEGKDRRLLQQLCLESRPLVCHLSPLPFLVYKHTHTYAHMHTFTHTHTLTHTHTHTHTIAHTYTNTHIHKHTCTGRRAAGSRPHTRGNRR